MRIVVDVPDRLALRAIQAVESGAFDNVDALVAVAVRRILNVDDEDSAADQPAESKADTVRQEHVPGAYVFDRRSTAPWLWGMVNRVLPLKLAVRVCAELTVRGPIPVPKLHAVYAERGLQIGRKLKLDDQRAGRLRNESLSTGFPLGDDEQKAKVRFAHQFVGRRSSSGAFVGGAFETGLIGPVGRDTDSVAPTALGHRLSALANAILDGGPIGSTTLDEPEREFYLFEIVRRIPAERNALSAVLSVLGDGSRDVAALASRLRPFQPVADTASVQDTSRSGALARFNEVGAIQRKPEGRSATYSIAPLGVRIREQLSHDGDRAVPV